MDPGLLSLCMLAGIVVLFMAIQLVYPHTKWGKQDAKHRKEEFDYQKWKEERGLGDKRK